MFLHLLKHFVTTFFLIMVKLRITLVGSTCLRTFPHHHRPQPTPLRIMRLFTGLRGWPPQQARSPSNFHFGFGYKAQGVTSDGACKTRRPLGTSSKTNDFKTWP
ncbi:hypothetical protein B0T09DRAFT_335035 [Sordaria sp. MPI-SDFR-AT-0083]|nr:hypothetical protein B0T09DRAFT_335035 [Sordaria sp. MPI-SDFR-AT-0083]